MIAKIKKWKKFPKFRKWVPFRAKKWFLREKNIFAEKIFLQVRARLKKFRESKKNFRKFFSRARKNFFGTAHIFFISIAEFSCPVNTPIEMTFRDRFRDSAKNFSPFSKNFCWGRANKIFLDSRSHLFFILNTPAHENFCRARISPITSGLYEASLLGYPWHGPQASQPGMITCRAGVWRDTHALVIFSRAPHNFGGGPENSETKRGGKQMPKWGQNLPTFPLSLLELIFPKNPKCKKRTFCTFAHNKSSEIFGSTKIKSVKKQWFSFLILFFILDGKQSRKKYFA